MGQDGGKKAYLRVDDFPYSGELFAKYERFRDSWMHDRFLRILDTCSRYDVVPEFMVGSHAISRAGSVVRFDEVMPATVHAMQDAFREGLLNLNAHGMFHLDAARYVATGEINPREFDVLDEQETRHHIHEVCVFIREVFDKEATGFVAPAWGYSQSVTKRVASQYFLYIADSYDHWLQGSCLDFGAVDPLHGFVHFPETWRYGTYSASMSISRYWREHLRGMQTLHLMQHGHRVPGTWRLALSLNPIKMVNHAVWGNLSGLLRAVKREGFEWSTLEEEALRILNAQSGLPRVPGHEPHPQAPCPPEQPDCRDIRPEHL